MNFSVHDVTTDDKTLANDILGYKTSKIQFSWIYRSFQNYRPPCISSKKIYLVFVEHI